LPSLPGWADRAITALLTLALFLTLMVAVGQGFLQRLFGRDLVLALDIVYVRALFKMLYDAEPVAVWVLVLVAVGLGLVLAVAGPWAAVRQLRRFVAPRSRRRRLAFAAGSLAYLAVGGALAGVHPPVAAEVADQLALVWNRRAPLAATARALEAEAAPRRALALPASASALPPHIFLFVVESYGHALFGPDPAYADFPAFLRQQANALARNGYAVRSTFLRSPVFGGGSWMADASLLCGVTVDNQKRFISLFESEVRCLPKWLDAAGYRTVLAAPSTEVHEERFARTYAFDASYFKNDFGYAGPRIGWSFIPDQWVLDFVDRREVQPHRNDRLFVTEVLTSSHTPWSAVPPVVDWAALGDGAIYDRLAPARFDNRLLGGRDYAGGYRASIEYSLSVIAAWLERLPADDRSLVIVLGDHQPQQPVASRWKDDRWVPVHVLGRDPAVVDRFVRFGFGPGILPAAPRGTPATHADLMGELLSALGAVPR
jgi:hypothetical protein